jgi:acyl-coenzyme A thioesterase PaaI-like protein
VSAQPARRTFWDVPAVAPDPAWQEKRRLASKLRELVALCVTTEAPAAALTYAADSVERLCERLLQHPRRTFGDAVKSNVPPTDLGRFADRGAFTGQSNPYAPPLELSIEGDRAIGRITFGPPYEGIPGHVHGGMVAAVFDQLFGYMQTKLGAGSVTAELTVHYRKPTPLLVPLHMEARILRTEGRRSFVAAKMLAGETLTAEADGIFVALDPQRFNGIIGRTQET